MASSTTAVDFEHCVQAPMTLRVPQDWKNPSRASSNHLDAMSPSTRDLGTSQGAKDVLACTSSPLALTPILKKKRILKPRI